MTVKPKLFIHIGLPRTGTTYLQEQIFRQADRIFYLGRSKKTPFSQWQPYETIERCVVLYDEAKFNAEKEQLMLLVQSIHLSKQMPNVLSHEGFTRTTRFNLSDGADIHRVIERLKFLFEQIADVHFILTFRNPVTCLKSTIVAFRSVFDHYCFNWDDLNKTLSGETIKFRFILDNFKYGSLYQTVERVCPQKNLILFFEDLKNNQEKFFEDLSSFLQCDIASTSIKPLNSIDDKIKKNWTNYKKKFTNRIWVKAFSIFRYPDYYRKICDFVRVIHWHRRDWRNLEYRLKLFYEKDFDSLPGHLKAQFKKHGYFPAK